MISVVGEVAILFAARRARNPHGRAMLLAVPVFAVWFALRASLSLLALDVIACGVLLVLGASLSRSGSIWELSVPRLVLRAFQTACQLFMSPAFLARSLGSRSGTGRVRLNGVVGGIAIAVPLVLVLGALLVSADVVFASVFEFDAGSWASHAAVALVGAIGMATLLRLASVQFAEPPAIRRPRLGVTEWTIVLGALDVLFAGFAIARLVALSEGGRRVIESAGLTYAEYARSGFFQLLAVSLIAGAILVTLRAVASTAGRSERRFKVMALVAVVLTLAIVVSAFHRLVLYEDVFGLTMLRLYSHTAIVWVGLVLVLLGVVLLTRPQRPWLTPAAGITALALLLALNVLNPAAFISEYNLTDERRSAAFDAEYLLELSDDAVPTIATHLARIDPQSRTFIKNSICGRQRPTEWRRFNLAERQADDARARLCR